MIGYIEPHEVVRKFMRKGYQNAPDSITVTGASGSFGYMTAGNLGTMDQRFGGHTIHLYIKDKRAIEQIVYRARRDWRLES